MILNRAKNIFMPVSINSIIVISNLNCSQQLVYIIHLPDSQNHLDADHWSITGHKKFWTNKFAKCEMLEINTSQLQKGRLSNLLFNNSNPNFDPNLTLTLCGQVLYHKGRTTSEG